MKKNLLIIEPDLFERDIFIKALSGQYKLNFMTNVCHQFELPSKVLPNAIIFDAVSPSISTLQSLLEARRGGCYEIPLIIIASENALEFERFAREQGVFYYLIKPFDFRELSQVLNAAIIFAAKKNSPESPIKDNNDCV